MKKYLLVLITFALFQVSCSDDNDPDTREDLVFQESQFSGYWTHTQTKDGDGWNDLLNSCGRNFIEFAAGNAFNEHGCSSYFPEKGKWTFNGKNVVTYEIVNGEKCQLSLVDVSDTEMIADVIVTNNGNEKKEKRKYRKNIFSMEDYYKYFTSGYKVKDISNFVPLIANQERNFLSGVKDNKLWVGYFDADTKEQVYEKKDKEDFSFKKRVLSENGSYEDFTVKSFSVDESIDDNLFKLIFYLSNENTENMLNLMLWFSKSGKKFDYNSNVKLLEPWYNNSYIINFYDDSWICFSEEGESIFTASDLYFPLRDPKYPVAYNYFVEAVPRWDGLTFSLKRIVDDGNTSWERDDVSVSVEQSDYKYAIEFVEQNEQSCTLNVDIIESSGKQHSHKVEMDISGITK